MKKELRPATLSNLGLGSVLDIFKNGKLPATLDEMVSRIFGPQGQRRAMVISGAGGIVGAGKVMQFASRLVKYNIPIIALDISGAADGMTGQIKALKDSFGNDTANKIMSNVIRMNYDGFTLPQALKHYNPCFLLEAIPENLELKKAHFQLFRSEFPDIHICSVTSGFPSSELGVSIAHPAFPHHINKIFEVVEPEVSDFTKMLWSMGLIPVQVSDAWSFVLDVFFCGLLQAGLQFCDRTNTPYWKADKYIRRLMGPNPFRAHDVIGAKGANFLTWSCLHHLEKVYGPLFAPMWQLVERKESGLCWYPANHFRPLVNPIADKEALDELNTIIYGALFQMTSIMINEKRADLVSMNAIGELCAQFTKGVLAIIRRLGKEKVLNTIERYHKLYPQAAETKWYPESFNNLDSAGWKYLYVNAEHDGRMGVISISRESYNSDVNEELNSAINWLKAEKIDKVIITSDFHFSTQMVGADTTEFYPAITDKKKGERISEEWSMTARRLFNEFETSVAFINGKRCMGGMLELMMHCHYLIAPEQVTFAMPEVNLPVIPGMEGCHWLLRKTDAGIRDRILEMLLQGKEIKAKKALGFLVDFTGSLEECIVKARSIVQYGNNALERRTFVKSPINNLNEEIKKMRFSELPHIKAAQMEIAECVIASCKTDVNDALRVQARISAEFMSGQLFRKGKIGSEYDKINSN